MSDPTTIDVEVAPTPIIEIDVSVDQPLIALEAFEIAQPGPKGDKGERGERGDKGDTVVGPRGPQGERGIQGEQGDKGDKGDTVIGPRGPQGNQGIQGERGLAGTPATSFGLQYVAGELISALRAVRIAPGGRVLLARPDELEGRLPLGISMQAAELDAPLIVQEHGELYDAGWDWTPGHWVLVSDEGRLTQQQPVDQAWLVQIGYALSPTTVLLRICDPMLLAQ